MNGRAGPVPPGADARHVGGLPACRLGVNVFEGLRAYWSSTREALHVFRMQNHYERLVESMRMPRPEGVAEMGEMAARASGLATAADVSPEIKCALPSGFLVLGMRTHRSFDALGDEHAAGASRDQALRSLAAVTAHCVACHAAYRLDAAR
jgi:hypothetical protein